MILFDTKKVTTAIIEVAIDRAAVKVGTPVDSTGAESNDEDAYGIVLNPSANAWGMEVITGGYVDIDAAEAEYGGTYSADAKAALSGIVFVEGGKLSLGNVGFELAENQAESTATTVAGLKEDFNALLEKLKSAGLMVEDEEE